MEKSVCVCVGGDGIITAVEEVVDKAMAMQNVEVRSSRSPDRLSITGLKFSLDHLSHFTLSSQHGENWWERECECVGGVNAHHNGCLTKFSQEEWGLLMTRLIYTCNELLITSAFSPQTAGSVLQLALKLTPGSRCVTAAWQDQSPRTGSGSRSECQLVSVLTVARFQRRETSRPLLSRDHFWCRLVWRCLSRCHGGQGLEMQKGVLVSCDHSSHHGCHPATFCGRGQRSPDDKDQRESTADIHSLFQEWSLATCSFISTILIRMTLLMFQWIKA